MWLFQGANNTILYKLNGYFDLASRPDNIIVELYIKANGSAKIVDTRVIPILMEAMSYTRMVRDMRENISANGRDISTIRQTANSMSVKVNNTEARLENGDFVVKSNTTKFIGADGQKDIRGYGQAHCQAIGKRKGNFGERLVNLRILQSVK